MLCTLFFEPPHVVVHGNQADIIGVTNINPTLVRHPHDGTVENFAAVDDASASLDNKIPGMIEPGVKCVHVYEAGVKGHVARVVISDIVQRNLNREFFALVPGILNFEDAAERELNLDESRLDHDGVFRKYCDFRNG